MQIDFVKLWREAGHAAMLLDVDGPATFEEMEQAAARVLEQAFTAAVEEERRKALEEAATIAMGCAFDEESPENVYSSIRALIGKPSLSTP